MTMTVREFVYRSYRLINASNPTVPLHGDDEKLAVDLLNELLQSYSSSGLLTTIAKTVSTPINIGMKEIIFTDANYPPPSDPEIVQIAEGRLANLMSAWLLLNGVTYPLIYESRDEFLAAWKYEPLQGLPRFIIVFPEADIVRARLYPAPSQFYEFWCRAKFQLPALTANDDMSHVPQYYRLFFTYALARQIAKFKARGGAWTPDLEAEYRELKDNMEGASEINLSITGDRESLLNGSWRVISGI